MKEMGEWAGIRGYGYGIYIPQKRKKLYNSSIQESAVEKRLQVSKAKNGYTINKTTSGVVH